VEKQVEEPSLRMNGVNYARALRAAGNEDAFVIEDDLIPANTLSAWIQYVENQAFTVPVSFYVWLPHWQSSDAAVTMANGGADAPAGVEPINNFRNWSGTQAMWWPKAYRDALLAQDRFFWDAYELSAMDMELRAWMLTRGEVPLITVPHLVQHRDYARITGGGAPHKSPMFRPDALPPTVVSVENASDTLDTMNLSPRKPRGKAKE
jgi:hypothetical protein